MRTNPRFIDTSTIRKLARTIVARSEPRFIVIPPQRGGGKVHFTQDQLTAMRSVDTQRLEAEAALASAEEAYQLAFTRYKAGLGSLLQLITVEEQVLAQRQLRAELRSRELALSINLIRALGGGFEVQVASQ